MWSLTVNITNFNPFIGQAQELTYFTNESETIARGTIPLKDALLSNITLIKERNHSFSI
jgi:hypothetical protein